MNTTFLDPAADAAATGDAWFLLSAGRRIGPLAEHELRGFFTSGMVSEADQVSGPGVAEPFPARELAQRWQLPLSARAAVPPPEVRMLRIERDTSWSRGFRLAAWALALLAVQMMLIPKGSLGATHSLSAFAVAAVAHWLAIGLACVFACALLGKLFTGHFPSLSRALLLMSAAYLALLGNRYLHPEAVPAPASAEDFAAAMTGGSAPAPAAAAAAPMSEAELASSRAMPWSGAAAAPAEQASRPQPQGREVVAVPGPPAVPAAPVASGGGGVDTYQASASQLKDAGNWSALRELAERWTQEQPQNARAWMYLGLAEHGLGQVERARAAFAQSVRHGADDFYPLSNAAWFHASLSETKAAIDLYERALALRPDQAWAWLNLGNAHGQMYANDKAIAAYQRAIALRPNDAMAHHHLGTVYYRLNEFDKAEAAYEEGLKHAPGHQDLLRRLAEAKQR